MIPLTAKIISPAHNHDDYGFKAGHNYEIKVNEGVGRYINGDGPTYLDNGELTPEVANDFKVVK